MTDTITLIGIVATPPRHLITNAGLAITSFRLASTQRRFDRAQEKWVDGDTNWYTVTTFRQLAYNAAVSVVKGDRVIVDGRIRVRDWQAGERSGTNIDIEADALGHDLAWGTARWVRTPGSGHVGGDSTDRRESSDNSADEFSFERSGDGSAGSASDAPSVSFAAANANANANASANSDADGDGDSDTADAATVAPISRLARKNRVSAPGPFADLREIPVPF